MYRPILSEEEDDDQTELLPSSGKQSVFGSILTLISTCAGSGLVAMPYAMSQLGIVHGFFWMAISCALIVFSLHCLSMIAIVSKGRRTSYHSATRMFASRMGASVDVSIIVQGWGVCISYLILIGNSLPILIAYASGRLASGDANLDPSSMRTTCISLCMFLVILPLCCLRSLRSLKLVSIMALVSMTYIVVLIFSYFLIYISSNEQNVLYSILSFVFEDAVSKRIPVSLWKWSFRGVATSVPIFIFGLTCHHNLFNVYNELKSPRTIGKMNRISTTSVVVVGMMYFCVAATGYITLGDGVDSKLFDSYEYGDIAYGIRSPFSLLLDQYDPERISLFLGRLALLVIAISAFPIQFFPIRISIINLMRSFQPSPHVHEAGATALPMDSEYQALKEASSFPPSGTASRTSSAGHYTITSAYCVLCWLLSLWVTSFGKVLSIVGATGDNYIALFFGPFIYLVMAKHSFAFSWKRLASYVLLLFSVLLFVGVLYSELFL